MEVVPQGKRLPPILPPFQRRDVEEWSTLDELTGILEHARVQTDHWAATTCNSSHHFGKVIDSRARNLADGSKEQRQQTKQLEVFQANIPGGSVQVIRSQSLTTSSWQGQSTTTKSASGSGWSTTGANSRSDNKNDDTEFDNLKLALNPLDISSQKMKASVVRRGSISSRRPPSRPRSIAGSRSDKPGQIMEEEEVEGTINHTNSTSKMSNLSRICQDYHEEAKNNSSFLSSPKSLKQIYAVNGTDTSMGKDRRNDHLPKSGPVTLSFLLDKKGTSNSENTIKNKPILVHKKSCSSEDLRISPETGLLKTEDNEINEDWKRSSKARRSLQLPVQLKSEPSGFTSGMKSVNSVLKVSKEIEARRQIVTNSLKNTQWEDVLKNVVNKNNASDKSYEKDDSDKVSYAEDELIIKDNNKLVKTIPSFITVESLKEVRGRLRRLGSPVVDERKFEEEDDGIVTEVKDDSPTIELEGIPKSVKSYVYGMESLLQNNRPKTITGTGSLESRSTSKSNGTNGNSRSEEWYNRRKSYGFEQVNGQSTTHGSNLYGDKNKVDSSTDSGICRSSETFANVQFWNKPISGNTEGNGLKTSNKIMIRRSQDKSDEKTSKESPSKNDTFSSDFMQKGRKTVVTLGIASKKSTWNLNNQTHKTDEQSTSIASDDPKEIVTRGKIADAIRSLREKASEANGFESRQISEPITISIPLSPLDDSEIVESNGLLLKEAKEPSAVEKYNSSKHEDSDKSLTSYSKLLYGTNYSENKANKKCDSINSENKSSIHLQISSWNRNTSTKDNDFKRHSIAVDEAKYLNNSNNENFEMPSVKDKIASFKNQFNIKSNVSEKLILPLSSHDNNKHSTVDNDIDSNANEKKQKKVEFCKTEVHFAAEPGRFNIVETDGKPPSSNTFRRRRRTIAETPARMNLPEVRFGDSQYEKDLLSYYEVNDPDTEPQPLLKSSSPVYRLSPQFIDSDKEEDCFLPQQNTLISIDSDYIKNNDESNIKINETDIQDEEKPRSILKHNVNKQHQNIENFKTNFEENDNLVINKRNINLNSCTNDSKTIPWKSTVTLQQNPINTDDSDSELHKRLKSLRPVRSISPVKQSTMVTNYNTSTWSASAVESSATAADNGLAVRISSAMNFPDQRRASWSVAERVRHVEDPKNKGFSTKVNFGSDETTVVTPELRASPVHDTLSSHWMTADSVSSNEASPVKNVQHVMTSNVVPTYIGSTNKVKSVETLVSTRSGHPKITSISLRYMDDVNNESVKCNGNKSQHIIRNEVNKTSAFKTHAEMTRNIKAFKNESNSMKVADYSPDNDSVSSKMLPPVVRQDTSVCEKKLKINQAKLHSPSNSESIYEEIKTNNDPKLLSPVFIPNKKLQSPSSDSVFFERSSEQSLYSQLNTRNRSMSPVPFPTRPVINLPDYANVQQVHLTKKPTVPSSISTGNSTVWSSVSVSKTKKKEVVKKDDKRKLPDDSISQKDVGKAHKKERRPSSSSSGRDGWLNTPKESNTKQRVNYSQIKRQGNVDIKREKKVTSTVNNQNYKSENSGKLSVRPGSQSPIYQNREVYSKTQTEKDPFESLETESAILEELTRAADQILLAVNGYTDEESTRASSDDDYKRKHAKDKPLSKPLSTISEMPIKKKITTTAALKKENISKTSGSPAQSSVGTSRTKLCKTSSNSSIEGTAEAKSLLTEERSKRRAARLLQRASSRELLLQNTGASSSEDVASGTETAPQRSKQRVVRRTAKQYSSRTASHQSSTVASKSRTNVRVQRTGGNTVDEKEPVSHSRRRADERSKASRASTTSGYGKTSLPPAGAIRCDRSSRVVDRRPPERQGGGGGGAGGYGGGGGGVGRTRNQHALSKKKSTIGASHRETISQTVK